MDMLKLMAELVEQLKGINRSLAILVGEPRASRHAESPKPNIIRSVALDGTVREAEVT
jgi:hypothetical protein